MNNLTLLIAKDDEKHRPEIVLLDISLQGIRGFEAARQILKNQPPCKLFFVSNYTDLAYVQAALDLGTSGYVLKSRI